ncbi:hypothetical protein ACIQU6_34860 [Streptomyces sp. NPDC090442]|uniref:hypothetical protein n=1 Tax=Streptomyces sp. NPDC090442 TaxID=3365962 RepID=UPI003819C9FE
MFLRVIPGLAPDGEVLDQAAEPQPDRPELPEAVVSYLRAVDAGLEPEPAA